MEVIGLELAKAIIMLMLFVVAIILFVIAIFIVYYTTVVFFFGASFITFCLMLGTFALTEWAIRLGADWVWLHMLSELLEAKMEDIAHMAEWMFD